MNGIDHKERNVIDIQEILDEIKYIVNECWVHDSKVFDSESRRERVNESRWHYKRFAWAKLSRRIILNKKRLVNGVNENQNRKTKKK
jgi:hypothetical protein